MNGPDAQLSKSHLQPRQSLFKRPFKLKRALRSALVAVIVVALGGMGLVKAQDLPQSWTSQPKAAASNQGYLPPDMQLEGAEVPITLDQAIQLATSQGTLAETASINRDMGKAKADLYHQTAEALDADNSTASEDARKLADLTADFAADQSDRNFTAEINALKRDTVKNTTKRCKPAMPSSSVSTTSRPRKPSPKTSNKNMTRDY